VGFIASLVVATLTLLSDVPSIAIGATGLIKVWATFAVLACALIIGLVSRVQSPPQPEVEIVFKVCCLYYWCDLQQNVARADRATGRSHGSTLCKRVDANDRCVLCGAPSAAWMHGARGTSAVR
jgi:hypothetical protein